MTSLPICALSFGDCSQCDLCLLPPRSCGEELLFVLFGFLHGNAVSVLFFFCLRLYSLVAVQEGPWNGHNKMLVIFCKRSRQDWLVLGHERALAVDTSQPTTIMLHERQVDLPKPAIVLLLSALFYIHRPVQIQSPRCPQL